MVVEFCLVGDSSLYTKRANGKPCKIQQPLLWALDNRSVEVAAYPGGGIRDILNHLTSSSFQCGTLGISYFGNEHTDRSIDVGRFKPLWDQLFEILPTKCQRCTFFMGGFSRKYGLSSVYDQNMAHIRKWVAHAGYEVKRCFEKVRTWPLARDRLHWAAEAKDDLVNHWRELLKEAPPVMKSRKRPASGSANWTPIKRPKDYEQVDERRVHQQVDSVIEQFYTGDFIVIMERLLKMKERALCGAAKGGLSDRGRMLLCEGLGSLLEWKYGYLDLERYQNIVADRLPIYVEKLVSKALWKKGGLKAPQQKLLFDGRWLKK